MLMIVIFYVEFDLEMEDVHAGDAMRETREGQKVQNVEHKKAYQGRKSNEMTSEGEERKKEKEDLQKEYRKRNLGELKTEEREEQ